MKKSNQILIVIIFILGNLSVVGSLFLTNSIQFPYNLKEIALWAVYGIILIAMVNEGLMLIKNGKRSDIADLILIAYLFVVVFMITDDVFDAFLGAFSIYLLIGINELKDYEVLNKVLYISIITYNIIFFTAILDKYLGKDGVWRDTMFSLSFWIMLILGFIFFGRRYLIVWRFMSPQYLILALYLFAWIAVSTYSDISGDESIMDYIYEVLIISNLIIYAFTGPLIDKMLGMKKVNPKGFSDDSNAHNTKNSSSIQSKILQDIIEEVAPKIGINPKFIKIRFGEYPIINAMAYGAFWDKRMAIIAPDINHLPKDELKGIVAHELAHLRGKHTLSLTFITIGELFVRKLIGWPATYYDYTFDPENQPFPMYVFILTNLMIFFFLYIFVRMFEAQADKNTKRAGYGYELAKGLYNLESFYASGREIGLNTMLLCDEKITENNRLINYSETAQYINGMIIKPRNGALLSNLMNSHPPSYHRIIISLNDDDNQGIADEATMPLRFLKKERAFNWFKKNEVGRKRYLELCNKKIQEEFNLNDLLDLNRTLHPKYHYKEKFGKQYVFKHLLSHKTFMGKIIDINHSNDVCEPIRFIVEEINIGENMVKSQISINPSIYDIVEYNINHHYSLKKEGAIYELINIDLNEIYVDPDKSKKKKTSEMSVYKISKNRGVYNFKLVKKLEDKKEDIKPSLKKPLFKYKLPKSFENLKKYENKTVYLREKGSLTPHILKELFMTEEFDKIKFTLNKIFLTKEDNSNQTTQKRINFDEEDICINKSEYVLKFSQVFVPIHNDERTKDNEQLIFESLKETQDGCIILLKKPVNNEVEGFIKDLIYNTKNTKIQKVIILDLFGETKEIERKQIDFLYMYQPTIIFQNKKNISSATKLIHKITQKTKPNSIIL